MPFCSTTTPVTKIPQNHISRIIEEHLKKGGKLNSVMEYKTLVNQDVQVELAKDLVNMAIISPNKAMSHALNNPNPKKTTLMMQLQ